MASYRSPSSGTKRRGQGRGRMSVPAARKKASTKRGRSAAEARKARTAVASVGALRVVLLYSYYGSAAQEASEG